MTPDTDKAEAIMRALAKVNSLWEAPIQKVDSSERWVHDVDVENKYFLLTFTGEPLYGDSPLLLASKYVKRLVKAYSKKVASSEGKEKKRLEKYLERLGKVKTTYGIAS